jgi:Zn-dependent peptidase ImmA (M78 family)
MKLDFEVRVVAKPAVEIAGALSQMREIKPHVYEIAIDAGLSDKLVMFIAAHELQHVIMKEHKG